MKYSLRQRSQLSKNHKEGSIEFQTFVNAKRIRIQLGVSVEFDKWDKKRQRCKNINLRG